MVFWRPLHKESADRIVSDILKKILKDSFTHRTTHGYPLILNSECIKDLINLREKYIDLTRDFTKLIHAIWIYGDIEIGEIL